MTDDQILDLAETHLHYGRTIDAIAFARALLSASKPAAIDGQEADTTDGNCGKCWPHKCSCFIAADTGNTEADKIIGRLMSNDPDFEDCTSAAVFICKLIADLKGPDGFATWKDAALDERMKRVSAMLAASPAVPEYTYETYTGQCGWLAVSKEEYEQSEYRKCRTPIAATPAVVLDDERCLICAETEPHTGTCGSKDPRALCNRATSPAASTNCEVCVAAQPVEK